MPSTPTSEYGQRQPHCWPIRVVSGTPTTLATVRPAIIIEIAQARRLAGTSDAPTTAPMPKNAPCGRPARNRAASRQW